MRVLLQRVSHASVVVEDKTVGEITHGLLVLVCAMKGDTQAHADRLAAKIAKLRIFADDAGKMNRSVVDVSGSVLVVSQFTLAADTKSGNRPGFSTAAAPEDGKRLYEYFTRQIEAQGLPTAKGIFGADMKVTLLNDGPVTLWMES